MSFGGATSAMLTTLKNNKRPRVSAFKKLKGYRDLKYEEGSIDKKATPQQLREIRERLQRENKKTMRLSVIIAVVLAISLFLLLFYVKF